ncbi:MAG: hypothetical protein ACPGO5_04405 [Patescibacteria group bacterium]
MTPSPSGTDKIPIRKSDGTIVMVDVAVAMEEKEKGAEVPAKPPFDHIAHGAKGSSLESLPLEKSKPKEDVKPASPPSSSKAPQVPSNDQKESFSLKDLGDDKNLSTKLEEETKIHAKQPSKSISTDKNKETEAPKHGASAEVLKEKIQKLAGSVAADPPTVPDIPTDVHPMDDQPAPLPDEAKQQPESIDWQASVQKVIESLELGLFDESHEARLRNVILSRLRDVRSVVQTTEALKKDRSEGGLGLADADVQKALAVINAEYESIHSKEVVGVSEPAYKKVEDPFRPKAELDALAEAELPFVAANPYLDTIAQHYTTKDLPLEQKQTPAEEIKPEVSPIALKPEEPQKQEGPKTKQFVTPTEENSLVKGGKAVVKPTMQDVVAKKRLMGPIDELKGMRLIDFRRLGTNTEERLQRVQDMIHDLEDESFGKKVEAIKAWRMNPLYQQYLGLGSESLTSNKSINDVITGKEQVGEETLSIEEFEMLTDFNKGLRY